MIAPVRPVAAVALVLSAGLVLAAGYPWGDMAGHTHWSRVGWIPFVSRPVRRLDIAQNLLLCVPLGAVAGFTFKRGVLIAAALAIPLSLFVETMQLYSHFRFPSGTDVICNIAGAILAAEFAHLARSR